MDINTTTANLESSINTLSVLVYIMAPLLIITIILTIASYVKSKRLENEDGDNEESIYQLSNKLRMLDKEVKVMKRKLVSRKER